MRIILLLQYILYYILYFYNGKYITCEKSVIKKHNFIALDSDPGGENNADPMQIRIRNTNKRQLIGLVWLTTGCEGRLWTGAGPLLIQEYLDQVLDDREEGDMLPPTHNLYFSHFKKADQNAPGARFESM